MRYIIIPFLVASFSALAIEPSTNDAPAHRDCFQSSKKQHLSYERSKNFTKLKTNEFFKLISLISLTKETFLFSFNLLLIFS